MSSYGHYGPLDSRGHDQTEKRTNEMKTEQWKRAMGLNAIQAEALVWLAHNFPATTPEEQFMGVVEEVGELSHAMLKRSQGIRKGGKVTEADMKDAVGDIVIYLINYCNMMQWNLLEIIQDVWGEVNERDWKEFPGNGIDK